MAIVAVLGTGLMGAPMARNLIAGGHTVRAWNRTRAKAEAVLGAEVCYSPSAAIEGAEFVLTMLSDGHATGAVIEDVAPDLAPWTIWLEMSSAKPEHSRDHAAKLAQRQVGFIDAPVSGGTKGAEAGTLAIMAGGEPEDFARAEPVLQCMGRPVRVGPVGAGQLAKLANQGIVAVAIAAVAEAMLFLEKGGADPGAVRDALKGGFADSTILQQHGARMTNRDFVPGGLSKFQLKDLDNLLAEADGLGLSLPVSQDTRDRFAAFVHEMGGADQDHSGLFLELLKRNGLTP